MSDPNTPKPSPAARPTSNPKSDDTASKGVTPDGIASNNVTSSTKHGGSQSQSGKQSPAVSARSADKSTPHKRQSPEQDSELQARFEAREARKRRSSRSSSKKDGVFAKLRRLSGLGPVELAAEASDYVYLWYRTRNWKAILAIVPPMLVLVTLGLFILAGRLRSDESMKKWYREQASEAIGMDLDGTSNITEAELHKDRTPEEEARQDLLFKRILQLGGENQEARYFVAVSNLRQGKVAAARSMLEGLAPIDRPGLDLAHAWLAEDMYRRTVRGESIPVDQIRHHLSNALERPRIKYHSTLYGLYARILEQENNLEGAARVLNVAGEQDPKLMLEPVLLYVRRGMLHQAISESDALVAKLQPKLNDPKTPPEERTEAYVHIARALQITNRIDESIVLAERGLSLDPNSKELKRTLSDSYRVKFRASLAGADSGKVQASLDMLNKAIEADPTNIAVQSELGILTSLGIASTEEKRVAMIRHIAVQGASNSVRLLLAESALQRGDMGSAINDYEVVLADKPNMTIALNNLAMLYAKTAPPQIEKAKQTIQAALDASPDVAEFLDTQGDIFQIEKNLDEAAKSYLECLAKSPERTRTREKLIAIYKEQGNTEEATKQEQISLQIEARLKEINERKENQASEQARADAQSDQPLGELAEPPKMKQTPPNDREEKDAAGNDASEEGATEK